LKQVPPDKGEMMMMMVMNVSWNWFSRDPPGRGIEREGPQSNEVSPHWLGMIGGETQTGTKI
jgi:hypothetical protein